MIHVVVPLLLVLTSAIMAFAWLGHIRFRSRGFMFALVASWLMVMPEYVLNVLAFRWGSDVYTGAIEFVFQ